MHGRPCYRVTFCDGSEFIADADHQWQTFGLRAREGLRHRTEEFGAARRAKRPARSKGIRNDLLTTNAVREYSCLPPNEAKIVTTAEMAATLLHRGRSNHAIRVCPGLELPAADLPIDPYVLGVWLGDGTRGQGAITSADKQVVEEIERRGFVVRKRASKYGYGILGLGAKLSALGIYQSKAVPSAYLRASREQRLDLLCGLMDTDGTANKRGTCEFDNCDLQLALSVQELLASLGIKARLREGRARLNGKDCGPKYRLKFTTTKPVFKLQRKLDRLAQVTERGTQDWRIVKSVEPVESEPVRCIQVDSASSLFLAGREMVPTHNSHLMRVAAIVWCALIPGLQVYLFRRVSPDLYKNHMEGPTSFPALLAPWLDSGYCKINYSTNQVAYGNGSKIHLCHCQHEGDVIKYQGPEIHVLMMDELTHFTAKIYKFLRSRVRIAGLQIPPQFAGQFPRILASTNPGGIGHNWVRAEWIAKLKPFELKQMSREDGGLIRQFIPARLADNPTLIETDPHYADRLAGLGNAALVKAMLEGDWNIVAGGALDDLWTPRVIVPRFVVPRSWRVDRSFDWGSSKPFSTLWWAEADGTDATLPDGSKWCPPKRTLILAHEWYGASAANEGLKMPARQMAKGIKEREQGLLAGKWIAALPRPGPADNSIATMSQPGTPTIAQEMQAEGVTWEESDKSPGSRKTGLDLTRARLAESNKDRPEHPALYFMNHCVQAISHLPVLPRDTKNPDDVDSSAEDHDYDALRYRVLATRREVRAEPMRF